MQKTTTITDLLTRWSEGHPEALDDLTPLVYGELRQIAQAYFRSERSSHTLEPTALVHEVYLELMRRADFQCPDRGSFYALAACLMRRALVDYGRRRAAGKRGGDHGRRVPFGAVAASSRSDDLLALDEALTRLTEFDAEKARIIELRFFAGLSLETTARCLAISPRSVSRKWRSARAWLFAELAGTLPQQ